jgi:hypothetical protein
MRQLRKSIKDRGLVNLSIYIRADQAAFLEQLQADEACGSKREALMLVLDRYMDIQVANSLNQPKED